VWFGADSEPSQGAEIGIATEEKAMKITALIAAALLASSGFARAQDATTVTARTSLVEHVTYHTSELATVDGIRGIRARIRQAALRLCAPPVDTLLTTLNGLACTKPAMRNAFAQVDRAITNWRNGAQANAGNILVRAR
jgi:UrcA family protein